MLAIFSLISLKKCVSFVMALYQFCQNRKRMNPPPVLRAAESTAQQSGPRPQPGAGALCKLYSCGETAEIKKGKKHDA